VIDWTDQTNLRVLDPKAPLDEKIDIPLQPSFNQDDERLPLTAMGEIVGNSGHEGIRLPEFGGDDSISNVLTPLSHADPIASEADEQVRSDVRVDDIAAKENEVYVSESESDTASQPDGMAAMLWGLMRGAFGSKNTNVRNDDFDVENSGTRK
jgi:hypothetical protein